MDGRVYERIPAELPFLLGMKKAGENRALICPFILPPAAPSPQPLQAGPHFPVAGVAFLRVGMG